MINNSRESFEEYIPLIKSVVKKFRIKGYDFNDLIQESYVVYHKCVVLFDENKGTNFKTYLITSIKNKMYELLKIQNNQVDMIAFEEEYGMVEQVEESSNDKLAINSVSEYIVKLTKDEQELLDMHFYQELTQKEIAEKLGVSQSNVSKRMKTTLNKLHKLLREGNINL